MIITESNLVYYLIERGLADPESVVDGDWMVLETSRRNRNFKVIRRHNPSYFVKQIQNWEPQAITTLRCEARCYWLAGNDAGFAPLFPFLPKYYDFDSTRWVLILELLNDGEDLTEYHRRLGQFPLEVARHLGRVLGAYHQIGSDRIRDKPENAPFQRRVPWILSADQLNASSFGTMSRGNTQVVGIVQQYPEFQQNLQALRGQWQFSNLVHGDLKWDNCIVQTKKGNGELQLKIVDWELADWGDPCWDVGAILQAYLSFWIMSMPVTAELSPSDLVQRAQYPLESMQPAIREFWRTYTETTQVSGEPAKRLLEHSVRCGAARMIQTAYEYMYYSPQISANTLCLLQVSLNVLTRSQEAITNLFGL